MTEALQNFEDVESDEERQAWSVTDDRSADWALRKIAQARKDTATWQAYYKAQMDKIIADNASTEAFFAGKLKEYFDKVPHHDTKTQSKYKLPSGELVLKQQDPVYKVVDQGASTKWLEQNNMADYVKIEKSVRWSELKKIVSAEGDSVFDNNGEMIPGIRVTPRDPEFSVDIK